MIGKFKLKRVSKSTGESEVLLEERNQTAAGFATAITDILTGTGSSNVLDYKFRYFQLGDKNYTLSSFGVSGDVPESRLKGQMWTLKSPLDISSYTRNSILPVVKKDVYGLGSIIPRNRNRVFDNFIDPPDNTTISDDYTNNFQTFYDGEYGLQDIRNPGTPSSIWMAGCSDEWSQDRYWIKHMLWTSAADASVSGPDYVDPVYVTQYNSAETVSGAGCVKINNGYTYANGSVRKSWNSLRKNQTASVYYATDYFVSSSASLSGSTPLTGALQITNTTAQKGTGYTEAGENRVTFMYRYGLAQVPVQIAHASYPPEIIDGGTGTGYTLCIAASADCESAWTDFYGSGIEGGTFSANVHCSAGAMYTYGDVLNNYTTRSGPGKDCYDVSNSGFGPSGNFYRISASLNNVPDAILSADNGVASGADVQIMHYPLLSALTELVGSATIGENEHNLNPREKAYLSNFQFEYNPSATSNQYIHGERPYYITTPQYFVQIPYSYSTTLNDNTINVRLFLDEYLANGSTLKEVGLFLKNPGGNFGRDNPYLSGYKIIDPPLEKNSEFSYIIDWELSVIDTGDS